MFCEDIQDMELTTAIKSLMALFVEQISSLSAGITNIVKKSCKIDLNTFRPRVESESKKCMTAVPNMK